MTNRKLSNYSTPATALLGMFVQVVAMTLFCLFIIENEILASAFFSSSLRDSFVTTLGGSVRSLPDGIVVSASLPALLSLSVVIAFGVNFLSAVINRLQFMSSRPTLSELFLLNALWTIPLLLWSCLWIAGLFSTTLMVFCAGTVNLFAAMTLAGWLCNFFRGMQTTHQSEVRNSSKLDWILTLLGMLLFTVVFTAMNWGLWFNLRIPHGDSAMYEEHLWNVTHGKGFRSYLDQGLFLGEHIQVIHLLLIPLHWLWSSQLLLELCETFALSLGAIPVYLIGYRHSNNSRAAAFVALAYLLYFPMHYLDIAVDLKTFRPISFGVPLLLWAINSLEQKKWRQMTLACLLAFASKEDYAIVIAPLGLWTVWNEWSTATGKQEPVQKKTCLIGVCLALFSTLYLLLAVKYAIPWFRSGETVHYARYFEEFGKTPTQIVVKMITSPQLLFGKLLTFGSILYFLRVVFPVGMPCKAWSQLLVAVPLFVLLCLNTIAMEPPVGPYHHFHAPLVPIVVWAACASVGINSQNGASDKTLRKATWVFSCALVTSFLFGFSPLSIRFWDPGQEMYWRKQYVMDERAKQFEHVLEQLPPDARVASTDYVHTRLTHFERSYDYSEYPRAVANYEDKVPDDTNFIVIDRRHKHSLGRYDDLQNLRELKSNKSEWEVLPDRTNGYFTILKRRPPAMLPAG